jgi:exodeoxyribonuclease VIII
MDAKTYRQAEGINVSALKVLISKSPAAMKAMLEEEREETKAMMIGTAIHTAVLEPELFLKNYCMSDIAKNTKAFKQMQEENPETIFLNATDWNVVTGAAQAVVSSKRGQLIFSDGQAEQSFFAELEGIKCKGRTDWITNAGRIIDLKSTESAHPRKFTNEIFFDERLYHMQAAFYVDLIKAATGKDMAFEFVAVEKTKPFAVGFFKMSKGALDEGRKLYKKALQIYADCKATNQWPKNDEYEIDVEVPKWLLSNDTKGDKNGSTNNNENRTEIDYANCEPEY